MTTVFGIFGLAIGIINYEIDVWIFTHVPIFDSEGDLVEEAMNSNRFIAWHTNVLRWIMLLSSFGAVGCLIMRHHYKITWVNQFFTTVQTESKK